MSRWRTEIGSVLMEYVVVNTLVAVPLIGFWHEIYDVSTGHWIGPGLGIQLMFQRLMSGIALPLP